MTCIVALGICLPVFAAEPAVAATTTLTNPKFVRDNGNDLALGMGTGVIKSDACTIDEYGNITVKLKRLGLDSSSNGWFSGTITEARFIDSTGAVVDENLVFNNELTIDTSQISTMPTGKKGIHLQLKFDMKPLPPGMNEFMNAYFTCDDIQSAEAN